MIVIGEPGPLATVQDPFGRPGWRRYGVPAGGAADAWSARLANRLAGNPEGAAVIEVTLGGASLSFERPAVIAVTGGLAVSVAGRSAGRDVGIRTEAGVTVRLEPADGARGYLAVGGGIEVEPVMGSASTELRSGFGGFDGRPLRSGDRLQVGPGPGAPGIWAGAHELGPLRILPGPQPAALDALVVGEWTAGMAADRAGVRLDGPNLIGAEVASMGLPIGAIQVPPDGRPIVMLVDRPVTGGYPVPACVIGADVGRVAQLRPGDPIAFRLVSREEALTARRRALDELAAVEPVGGHEDDLGWAGSHR